MGIVSRAKQAWNAFTASETYTEPTYQAPRTYGGGRPDRTRLKLFNEKTIITAILVRMAIDVSGVNLRHVKVDGSGRYLGEVDSALNDALNLETNLDQAPRAFRQDIVMTMFDDGAVAIVPIDVIRDPETKQVLDIHTLRVGKIIDWAPQHVKVSVYNEAKGIRQDLWVEKQLAAVVENPFYPVMNQPSSTLQRLIRKLSLLDSVDEQSASGKLDLIIQLPYTIKTDVKRAEAKKRRDDIEEQLTGSRYGIAYADATEKIVQLNRPVENNLLKQVEFLTDMLYGQMGVTKEIMDGTADEAAMLNYFDRTIEPVIDAIAEAMRRTYIGQKKDEKISYFRNPFKLVPLSQLADIVDKLGRNEVMTSNEIRGYMGIPPSTDPKADELQNSNMPTNNEDGPPARLQKEGQDEV